MISDLSTLIRDREVVFFMGAGASWDPPAQLPTSFELVEAILPYVMLKHDGPDTPATFINEVIRGVRFELFIEAVATAVGDEAIGALLALEGGRPNGHHHFVSQLASHSLSPFVLTTNFDSLIEKALDERNVGYDMWFRDSHYRRGRPHPDRFAVLKLHGSLRDDRGRKAHSTIVAAANDVGRQLRWEKARTLRSIFKQYHIVFLGYSGLDDFDLAPLILTTTSDKRVYWIHHRVRGSTSVVTAEEIRRNGPRSDSNPELIVSSRPEGFLIHGHSRRVIHDISSNLFGKTLERVRRRLRRSDYSYLDAWASDVLDAGGRAMITGLLLQALEQHASAARLFEKVPADSRHYDDASFFRAVSLRRSGDVDVARPELTALAASRRASKPIKSRARVELGLLENERSNLRDARRHLRRALRDSPDDITTTVAAHNHLGMGFLLEAERLSFKGASPTRVVRTANLAADQLRAARRVVGRHGSPQMRANIHGNLGLAYTMMRNYKTADVNFAEARRLFRSLGLRSEEAACLSNIGFMLVEKARRYKRVSTQRQQLDQALGVHLEAYRLKIGVSTPRRIAFSEHAVGQVYAMIGDIGSAQTWLLSARDAFREQKLEQYARDVEMEIATMGEPGFVSTFTG